MKILLLWPAVSGVIQQDHLLEDDESASPYSSRADFDGVREFLESIAVTIVEMKAKRRSQFTWSFSQG